MTSGDQTTSPVEDPGDDSSILRIIAAWDTTYEAAKEARTGISRAQATSDKRIFLNLYRGHHGRQCHFLTIRSCALVKLGPSVWDISPALHVPGQVAAFVTLVAVPEPAPWERAMPAPVHATQPVKKPVWVARCEKCGESESSDSPRRERLCVPCQRWVGYEEA